MHVLLARDTEPAETVIDLSGCRAYRLALDVDEAVWGTRDPTSEGASDVVLTVTVSTPGRDRMQDTYGFCRGGRAADGGLPSLVMMHVDRWFDSVAQAVVSRPGHWPKGTCGHLRLETVADLPVGLVGDGLI